MFTSFTLFITHSVHCLKIVKSCMSPGETDFMDNIKACFNEIIDLNNVFIYQQHDVTGRFNIYINDIRKQCPTWHWRQIQ